MRNLKGRGGTKMRYLLMLSLIFWVAGCEGLVDKRDTNSTGAEISVDEFESIFLNTKTGKILEFTPCGNSSKEEECEIFKDEFRTVMVRQIVVIDSIKNNNTKCCRTYIFGENKKVEFCMEFDERITECPENWVNAD